MYSGIIVYNVVKKKKMQALRPNIFYMINEPELSLYYSVGSGFVHFNTVE